MLIFATSRQCKLAVVICSENALCHDRLGARLKLHDDRLTPRPPSNSDDAVPNGWRVF